MLGYKQTTMLLHASNLKTSKRLITQLLYTFSVNDKSTSCSESQKFVT